MPERILQEISCPNCTHPIDISRHGSQVECEACSSRFILQGHLCPNCSTYHAQETTFCGRCGQSMVRTCGKCRTKNWAGDKYCRDCGEAMDIFDILRMQTKHAHRSWMNEHHETVRRIKDEEEQAAQRRMDELMALEAKRQNKIRRESARRRQQDA